MKKLARSLRINQAQCIGVLESLWHWAGSFAQQGDVGRFDDEDIAEACFWSKEPRVLIDALLETRWLDADPVHRLLIHDWQDHADEAVRKYLDRHGLPFLSCRDSVETVSRHPPDIVETVSASREAMAIGSGGGKGSGLDAGARAVEKRKAAYSPEYEAFWLAVAPHKRDKKAEGYRRYGEALRLLSSREPPVEDPVGFLLEKATAYYASPLGKTPFCNGPAPWLHQGGYDGSPEAWQRGNEKGFERHEPKAVGRIRSGETIHPHYAKVDGDEEADHRGSA